MLVHRFQTYFPHVDNVYSHRSTQRYKRRPFVSYYWDCRLKGRPPGTPKSDDPNKKKRKRTARERDLCDVKIKITEYFPGAGIVDTSGGFETLPAELLPGVHTLFPVQGTQPFGVLAPGSNLPDDHPGANGDRYFTIQRVNGNGANGKNEGVGGGHRHTLEDSDRVKKNSVQRHILKEEKERKKAAVRLASPSVGCCFAVKYLESVGRIPAKQPWLRHSQHHFLLSHSAPLISAEISRLNLNLRTRSNISHSTEPWPTEVKRRNHTTPKRQAWPPLLYSTIRLRTTSSCMGAVSGETCTN